jgi:DNA processing protein
VRLLRDFPRSQILNGLVRKVNGEASDSPLALSELMQAEGQASLLRHLGGLAPQLRRRKMPRNAFSKTSHHCITGYFDRDFPALLREIPDPPLVLYYRGDLACLERCSVGVVGARRCTRVGASLATEMASKLAAQGVCVVSGLAMGIDGAAHRGALQIGGVTCAFLGAGLECLYPRDHHRLADEIVSAGGLLVSEYPPGTTPRPYQFPERNRLISGAAAAVVLVEASDKSGSLITARLALEQGRDVYAMPGPVRSNVSRGCHRLLRQGAALVTGAEDVLQELGWIENVRDAPEHIAGVTGTGVMGVTGAIAVEGTTGQSGSAAGNELTQLQGVLHALLGAYPVSFDELLMRAHHAQPLCDAAQVTQALIELELLGFVRQTPLGYIRTS